jgi:cation diffusion facilitator CzcD-associated flavoprotein CzcO
VFAGWVTVRAAGEAMDRRRVLIVGGGIAGLALAPQV